MKLPKGKKERVQILVLIGIGVVGVLYMSIQLAVLPLIKDRKDAIAAIADLDKKLETAKKEIDRGRVLRDQDAAVRAKLVSIDSDYVVKAPKGKYYELTVEPILKRAAMIAGVKLSPDRPMRTLGEYVILRGTADGVERKFKAFKVEFAGTGYYEGLLEMLQILESENPYVSVLSISIAPGADWKNSFSFQIQWPVWQDPGIVKEFAPKVGEGEKAAPAAASGLQGKAEAKGERKAEKQG